MAWEDELAWRLHALAVGGLGRLEESFEAVRRGATHASAIDEFASVINAQAVVGFNARPSALLGIFSCGAQRNVWELSEEESRMTGAPIEEILRRRLGSWYDLRRSFDDSFCAGQRCFYGALHLEGCGDYRYGPYCVVSNRVAAAATDLVILVCDSLCPGSPIRDAAGRLLEPELAGCCAVASGIGWLAALKHHHELGGLNQNLWGAMIWSSGVYLEAIYLAAIRSNEIRAVIVSKDWVRKVEERAAAVTAGNAGSSDDATDYRNYTLVRELLENHQVLWLEVDP